MVVLTNVSDMKITSLAKEKGAEQVLIKSESEPDDVIGLVRAILAVKETPRSLSPVPCLHDEPLLSLQIEEFGGGADVPAPFKKLLEQINETYRKFAEQRSTRRR